MAGNETSARIAADARLKDAEKNGTSQQAAAARVERNLARDAELRATGGNRQAGER